jgi:hypothetical protein
VETKAFDPITTEDLIDEMNKYFGVDVSEDFHRYIYGKGTSSKPQMKMFKVEDDIHRQFTQEELNRML